MSYATSQTDVVAARVICEVEGHEYFRILNCNQNTNIKDGGKEETAKQYKKSAIILKQWLHKMSRKLGLLMSIYFGSIFIPLSTPILKVVI